MLLAKGHEKRVQSYNFFTKQPNLSAIFIKIRPFRASSAVL